MHVYLSANILHWLLYLCFFYICPFEVFSVIRWVMIDSCLFGVLTCFKIHMQNPRKEVNAVLKKEAAYFGDIVILPFMDRYELVVLKTIAICEFGVSLCFIIF